MVANFPWVELFDLMRQSVCSRTLKCRLQTSKSTFNLGAGIIHSDRPAQQRLSRRDNVHFQAHKTRRVGSIPDRFIRREISAVGAG